MPIAVDIDVMPARRKMSVGELAERVGRDHPPPPMGDLLRRENDDFEETNRP